MRPTTFLSPSLLRMALFGTALLCAGCHGSTATTPSATTTTVADPTETLNFNGTLAVAGSKFFSFPVAVNGRVDVTLVSVGGTGIPPTVALGLGIGNPAGTGCSTTKSVSAQAGIAAPQATGTFAPGTYCVLIADIGNLGGPATFAITIAHP